MSDSQLAFYTNRLKKIVILQRYLAKEKKEAMAFIKEYDSPIAALFAAKNPYYKQTKKTPLTLREVIEMEFEKKYGK